MRLFIFSLVCICMVAYTHAQNLPPALQHLNQQLHLNQQTLTNLRTTITALEHKNQQQSFVLKQSTKALVHMARQPEALVLTHSFLSGNTNAAGVLAASRKHVHASLTHNHNTLAKLGPLYQQSANQLHALQTLAHGLAQHKKRLNLNQKIALNQAAIQAEHLASALNIALSAPAAETLQPSPQPSVPRAHVLPVNGKLIKLFSPQSTTPGWTFSAKPAAEVISITGGEVLYSGPFKHYGGMVIISPAPKHHVVYTGLEELRVNAGSTIAAGHILGALPPSTPARLYVEYRKRGKLVSPHQLYE
jgi:septal ring factor EnvC (AmiA/AmiB activator)